MKSEQGGSTLGPSVITERGPERLRVGMVTFAVLSGAASYIIMLFIAMPLSIHLIVNVSNGCNVETDPACFAATEESQKQLTTTLTILRIMTFMFGTLVGAVSDKVGRKPMLAGALFGYSVTGVLLILGWQNQSLLLFYVGAAILGASSPITPHGIAYVSDISAPERLATNLGILQGIGFFIGLMAGAMISLAIAATTTGAPVIPGAPVLEPYNRLFFSSYSIGLAFSFIAALLMMCGLPESLHTSDRKQGIELTKANPLGFVAMISRSAYTFFVWLSAFFAYISAGANEAVTGGWWMRRYLQTDVGMFISYVVILWCISGVGSVIMTKVYTGVKGLKFACHISLIMSVVTGIAFSLAPTVGTSYMAAGVSFFGASAVPTILAVLMGQVDTQEKGAMSGALRSSEALGKLIGIVIFGTMFSNHIKPFTPDADCIPSTYSQENKTNSCECGVQTCPDAPTFATYSPKECSLGQLSPVFLDSPSKYSEADPTHAVVPNDLVRAGHVKRLETCLGGGGSVGGFVTTSQRVWCASTPQTNPLMGCPGFDITKALASMTCHADSGDAACAIAYADVTCDENCTSIPETERFYSNHNITLANVLTSQPACPDAPDVDFNLCWVGPIAEVPGIFPLMYFTVLPAISYLFFLIAEVCFGHHDRKFWRRDAHTVVPTTDE